MVPRPTPLDFPLSLHPTQLTTMSAPQIPNLNTLRRGGGRGRGRGRGSFPESLHLSQNVSKESKDKIIQSTDLDAATSRLSAVECGYLDDPFAKLMLPGGHTERRLPLMNRGLPSTTEFGNVKPTLLTWANRNIRPNNSHRHPRRQIPRSLHYSHNYASFEAKTPDHLPRRRKRYALLPPPTQTPPPSSWPRTNLPRTRLRHQHIRQDPTTTFCARICRNCAQ